MEGSVEFSFDGICYFSFRFSPEVSDLWVCFVFSPLLYYNNIGSPRGRGSQHLDGTCIRRID